MKHDLDRIVDGTCVVCARQVRRMLAEKAEKTIIVQPDSKVQCIHSIVSHTPQVIKSL